MKTSYSNEYRATCPRGCGDIDRRYRSAAVAALQQHCRVAHRQRLTHAQADQFVAPIPHPAPAPLTSHQDCVEFARARLAARRENRR